MINVPAFDQDFFNAKFLLLFIYHFFIDWPWWAIFTPLWIWKTIAALGATVGAIVWCRYPHYRFVFCYT